MLSKEVFEGKFKRLGGSYDAGLLKSEKELESEPTATVPYMRLEPDPNPALDLDVIKNLLFVVNYQFKRTES